MRKHGKLIGETQEAEHLSVINSDSTAHITALGYKLNPVRSAIDDGNTAIKTDRGFYACLLRSNQRYDLCL